VATCKRLGVNVHLTFTFGLEGETLETIRQTLDFALDLDPDSAQFSLATPFPGTRFYDEVTRSGNLLTDDWRMFDGNRHTVIQTQSLTREELEAALSQAIQEWNDHLRNKQSRAAVAPHTASLDMKDKDGLRVKMKEFYTNYKQYYVTNSYYQIIRQSTNYDFYDYLASVVGQDMDVLDVGSSSGVLTMEVSRLARSATGVDISRSAKSFADALKEIEYQRHQLIEKTLECDMRSSQIKRVEFVAASAEDMPFDDGRFDLVYSTDVLEHIVDPRMALTEMCRCVRPGGHIVVQVIKPNQIDLDISIDHWTENCAEMADRDAVSQVEVADFLEWCDELGLTFSMLKHDQTMIFAHLVKPALQ
jgi:2-polyprenyl-3-methyl-5-hydroxy-6-metoxy-1,4-benzoquinol methylase